VFTNFFPDRFIPTQAIQNAPDSTGSAGVKVWAVIGDPNKHPSANSELVMDASRQAVRCCGDRSNVFTFNGHARPNWKENQACGVYTYMQNGTNAGSCLKQATYREADHFCKSTGGRLCTKTELESACTAHTGCGIDDLKVWSSTTQSYNDNNMYNPHGDHVDIHDNAEVPDLVDFWANRNRAEFQSNMKLVGPGAL
jgi:hypothetical protein